MRHFHVSHADLGERVIMTPRIPYSANPAECPNTKRVCFAPTVWQCLAGICGTSKFSCILNELLYHSIPSGLQPAVYVTRRKLVTPPKLVSDYEFTGEVWSLEPIEVVRIGYVDLRRFVSKLQVGVTSKAKHDLSKEFYAGWCLGDSTHGVDWQNTPPKK